MALIVLMILTPYIQLNEAYATFSVQCQILTEGETCNRLVIPMPNWW
jgi:hypothetical protein